MSGDWGGAQHHHPRRKGACRGGPGNRSHSPRRCRPAVGHQHGCHRARRPATPAFLLPMGIGFLMLLAMTALPVLQRRGGPACLHWSRPRPPSRPSGSSVASTDCWCRCHPRRVDVSSAGPAHQFDVAIRNPDPGGTAVKVTSCPTFWETPSNWTSCNVNSGEPAWYAVKMPLAGLYSIR